MGTPMPIEGGLNEFVIEVESLALHLGGVPAEALQALAAGCMGKGRPDFVWASGSDKGSLYHLRKWIERARAEGWPCEAAQISEKPSPLTWASLDIRNRLGEKDRDDYRHYGALLIAKTAFDKATKDSEGEEIPEDDPRREDALKTAGTVTKIANCLPTPLYYQRNEVMDES